MMSIIERQKGIWIYFGLTSRCLNLEILGFSELFWLDQPWPSRDICAIL